MTKSLFYTLTAICLTACTLTGTQELNLNKQLNRYVDAMNENNTLVYVGLSHHTVVNHYQNLGDSVFITHFNTQLSGNTFQYSNPSLKELRKKDNHLEQFIMLSKYNDSNIESIDTLYGISEDGGDNWFFVQNEDYHNKKINFEKKLFNK
jgi:hypothetical protein